MRGIIGVYGRTTARGGLNECRAARNDVNVQSVVISRVDSSPSGVVVCLSITHVVSSPLIAVIFGRRRRNSYARWDYSPQNSILFPPNTSAKYVTAWACVYTPLHSTLPNLVPKPNIRKWRFYGCTILPSFHTHVWPHELHGQHPTPMSVN